MEPVGGLHQIGYHAQNVLEELGVAWCLVLVGVHSGQWCSREAHEFDGALVAQPFGHAGYEELHDSVGAVGPVPHEIQGPSDDLPLPVGGHPAGHPEDRSLGVDRIEDGHAGVSELVQTAQGELHFGQGLELCPLFGYIHDLGLDIPGCVVEGGQHVGDIVPLGLVDGGADILPFLSSGLPLAGGDDHLRAHFQGGPAPEGQLVPLGLVDAVEDRGPGVLGAVPGEVIQIRHEFVRVAEGAGGGQGDAVHDPVGDCRPAGG